MWILSWTTAYPTMRWSLRQSGEFEYHIDAWTGEVLSGQKDILASGQSGDAGTETQQRLQ